MTLAVCLTPQIVRAADEEMVDNPAYQSWASHEIGTTVTLESSTDAAGEQIKMEVTSKLVEATKEKAVVETTRKISIPGAPAQQPHKETIPAKVKKSDAPAAGKLPEGFKGDVKEKGSEKVKAGGKTYECKVSEFSGEQNGVKMTGRIWLSEKVPGGLVKMEMSADAGDEDMKTTMAVTKIERK